MIGILTDERMGCVFIPFSRNMTFTNGRTSVDLLIRDALEGGSIEKVEGQFQT